LEEKFYSKDMKQNRKKLATITNKDPNDFEEINLHLDILDFFDTIGALLESRMILTYHVWSAYCYWIFRYWEITKPLIS
jgi:hypothetical protein